MTGLEPAVFMALFSALAAMFMVVAPAVLILLAKVMQPPAVLPEQNRANQLLQDAENVRRQEIERQRQQQREESRQQVYQSFRAASEDKLFAELAQNIKFTKKRVLMGTQKTGERYLGMLQEESSVPSDGLDVRPIRDMNEMAAALPSELGADDDIFDARLASGELMVQVAMRNVPLMEDVHEPVYKDVIHVVYLLLDVSPSMFPKQGEAWRPPIWKGLALKLLFSSVKVEAPFHMRVFADRVYDLMRAVTPEQAEEIGKTIASMGEGSGTNIQLAVQTALEDFKKEDYDKADIMILTDGEDENVKPVELREALDKQRIKLHAVMLGVKNEGLRSCCDTYQVVEWSADKGIQLYPLVVRS